MPQRDYIGSWYSLAAGFARGGSVCQALAVFKHMVACGVKETPPVFSSLLAACSDAGLGHEGLQLQCRVVSLGFADNLYVGSALIDLYLRVVRSPDLALRVFFGLPHRAAAACNSVLRGFCDLGLTRELLGFFLCTRAAHTELNGLSFSYLLRGCCGNSGRWLDEGKQLHCHIVKAGWLGSNLFLSNALVDLYSAAGELNYARRSFDCIPVEDVISWNSMIAVYAEYLFVAEALECFHRMLGCGKRPSIRSFVALLNLSSRTGGLLLGVQMHGAVLKAGFDCCSVHVQSALIDMYGKCLDIESSVLFLNGISVPNLECYNSLVTSLLHCNILQDVVEMFGIMVNEGIKPDNITLSATVKALSSLGSANLAGCQMLHSFAIKLGFETNEAVMCSLVDAYARSGHIVLSHQIFENIEDPNAICFTALISAYAHNGSGREGVELLDEMIKRGLRPDGVTLLCVLAGCDHAGLVKEGKLVFKSMKAVHGLEPDRRHYSCMVNLLGRAGLLEEALELMRAAPFPCNAKMWSSLLHNSRVHGNEEVGRKAAKALMELQPKSAAACLQVWSFYSEISDLESSSLVKEMMEGLMGLRKEIGYSLIEVKDG